MKALITGVTGFAGGHLAEHLLQCGDEILGVARKDRWPDSAPDPLKAVPLVSWNVTRRPDAAVRETIASFQPDIVFHLAGISVPADCGIKNPTDEARLANVEAVEHVVDLLASLPNRPRLAFASSCQVYAAVDPENAVVEESAEVGPERAYGKTKLAAEQIIENASGLDSIILRAFNHAGPRQAPRMMLSEWACQLANSRNGILNIISRDSHLDLTDVRDTVRAYRDLAVSAEAGVYNVGSGESVRSGDVLDLLLQGYDADVLVKESRPGHSQLPVADNQRLRDATGWQREIPLKQTVADTMQYWLEQTR